MSRENVILSSCFHENFESDINKKKNANLCKNCGIVSIGTKSFSKPEEFDYVCEFDQKAYLAQIKKNFKEKIIKNKDDMNMKYIEMRPKIISYLKKLCEVYEYSKETFHAALLYADKILINTCNSNMKLDLTVIGCLLLAVKFIEKDPAVPTYTEFRNSKREYFTKEEISNSEKVCLLLLDFQLNVLTSFDILKYFLVNGLITSSDRRVVSNFYQMSVKILNYFVKDTRSLDFSPAEVAIASLVRASEISQNQSVKTSLSQIYEVKATSYMNASFVIKSIHPDLINNLPQVDRLSSDPALSSNQAFEKQNTPQKTNSYKELQYVNMREIYKFYQFGNMTTIPAVNMGLNMSNMPNISLPHLTFQQFNNYSGTKNNKSYFNIHSRNILKQKSPNDSSLFSTQGSYKINSNRDSEDSYVVDMENENSPKIELSGLSSNSIQSNIPGNIRNGPNISMYHNYSNFRRTSNNTYQIKNCSNYYAHNQENSYGSFTRDF